MQPLKSVLMIISVSLVLAVAPASALNMKPGKGTHEKPPFRPHLPDRCLIFKPAGLRLLTACLIMRPHLDGKPMEQHPIIMTPPAGTRR